MTESLTQSLTDIQLKIGSTYGFMVTEKNNKVDISKWISHFTIIWTYQYDKSCLFIFFFIDMETNSWKT